MLELRFFDLPRDLGNLAGANPASESNDPGVESLRWRLAPVIALLPVLKFVEKPGIAIHGRQHLRERDVLAFGKEALERLGIRLFLFWSGDAEETVLFDAVAS